MLEIFIEEKQIRLCLAKSSCYDIDNEKTTTATTLITLWTVQKMQDRWWPENASSALSGLVGWFGQWMHSVIGTFFT